MSKCERIAHVFDKKWRSDDVRLQDEASFSSLLLPQRILKGLENAGYKTPSPIQLESIPVGRFGRDLLVQAKSGTGKTLVFTVIALESLTEIKYPQVLIMAPTREIALQICDVVRAVGSSFKNLSCNCFIGGVAVDSDVEKVHGCQIIVGTPGRLKHLISLGILPTNSIRLLVLDEADVLLESNFKDDLDYIFVSLPKEKQVIATSATYPRELRTLTRQYFRKAYLARLNRNELTLLGMVHYAQVLELSKMSLLAYKAKLAALENVVTSMNFTQCLVFCNLISRVESLCYDIRNWGFTSTFISSAKEQCDRIRAIECLKRFKCKILVTSDVTARGIDAENVDLVVNFDKPFSSEVYFHRCGRAGRYGAKGVAITFLEKNEAIIFDQMKLKHNLKAYDLPDPIPRNLINIRPANPESSSESSEDDGDSSEKISNKDSEVNGHSSDNNGNVSKKNICADSSKLCNGKTSSNLNGYMIEKNAMNEPTSLDKDTNLELNTLGEFDIANKNDDSTLKNESSKLSAPGTIKQNLITEVVIRNGDNQVVNEISVTAELVKDKNSFLEYLESKNIGSSSYTAEGSDSSVVNNASTDNIFSQELISNTISEANSTDFQIDSQDSSEKQCMNNVHNTLEADNNGTNSKAFKLSVSEDEIKENIKKLIPLSDVLESLILEKNSVISVDASTPSLPNTSELDQVPKEDSTETKIAFIPNKIQLSVGKFLMEHVDNCDVDNLNSTESDKDCFANKAETEQDITKTFKDIRGDLTNFYSKVYKAFKTENLTDAAFEDIKVLIMQQKESAKGNVNHSNAEALLPKIRKSEEKITKNIHNELNKENGENSADLKSSDDNVCDASLYSLVSNESILSQENKALGAFQVTERFVFKTESSEDTSLSSSDSNEDPYFTLKTSFDTMKTSEKAKSKTTLHATQKSEKEKCVNIKKKKFHWAADKGQQSSPLNFEKLSECSTVSSSDEDTENVLQEVQNAKSKTTLHATQKSEKGKCVNMKEKKFHRAAEEGKQSSSLNFEKLSECSTVSSSDEDTENVLQEVHGAKKMYSEKQNFRSKSNQHHQAKPRSKNNPKSCNVARIGDTFNRTLKTISESSEISEPESLRGSQYVHNTSTPYFKGSKPANRGYQHRTSAASYRNMPLPSHHYGNTSSENCGNISSTSQPQEHSTHAVNYGNIPSTSQHHQYTAGAMNCGNIPSTSQHHQYTASVMNCGYNPSTSQLHQYTASAMNCGNIPSTSHHHQYTASVMNCGNNPSSSQHHEHTYRAANYGNFPSMNHHQECQLPSYPHSHQLNGHAPHSYRPYQVNMSHTGHGSHHQLRNVCCQNCSADWYEMYMKQWQFIHSYLF